MTTLDRLCDRDEPCEWGMAVNVRDDLIYVTQPSLSRIVVINVRDNLRPQHVSLYCNCTMSIPSATVFSHLLIV